MPYEANLFDQIGRLLERREGWHFGPSTTPGLQPSWCLDPGGEITLAVSVIDGAVCVYVPTGDREIWLERPGRTRCWIDRNEAEFLLS